MNDTSPWSRTERLGIEQFGPKHMSSASGACKSLFKQFVQVMRAVYGIWHDAEPEWSEQVVGEVVGRWKENYAIANERWGEAEDFLSGLQALVQQMQTWKPKGMNDRVKAGAMTKEQMALVRYMKDKVEAKKPGNTLVTAGRLEWQGNTVSFVEVFEGLKRKGYLSYPEGSLEEFVRRLQRSFIVLKQSGEELTTASLANRFNGRQNDDLYERMDALPDAKKKKPKGE